MKQKKKYKAPEPVKLHHDGILWPREIATGYRSGKSIEWVVEQCQRYAHPTEAYSWVKTYINGE